MHRSVLVQRALLGVGFSTLTGLAMAPNGTLYAASIFGGSIGQFRLDAAGTGVEDTLVRAILPRTPFPQATGSPQGIAVGGDGTLYYTDINLVGTFRDLGPGPDGKLRRIRFDANGDPLPPETIRSGLALPDGVSVVPGNLPSKEWRSYAGGPAGAHLPQPPGIGHKGRFPAPERPLVPPIRTRPPASSGRTP